MMIFKTNIYLLYKKKIYKDQNMIMLKIDLKNVDLQYFPIYFFFNNLII